MTLRTVLSATAVGTLLVVGPIAAASADPEYPPKQPPADSVSVPAQPREVAPVENVTSPSGLARTGSEVAVLGAAAAGLVAGGAGLVVVARRRRSDHGNAPAGS